MDVDRKQSREGSEILDQICLRPIAHSMIFKMGTINLKKVKLRILCQKIIFNYFNIKSNTGI